MKNPLEVQQNVFNLVKIIKDDLVHPYYKHVCELHELYEQLITGKNIDALMRQFVQREDSEMFEQRKRLTQHIVTAVSKNLMDVNYKIPRSTSKKWILRYGAGETPQDKDKFNELSKVLSKFYGKMSWNDWLDQRMIELSFIDPNAWVVFEFETTDGTKRADPYPFEICSEEAIYFEMNNGDLIYLVGKFDYQFTVNDTIKEGNKYTLYGQNHAITFLETITDTQLDKEVVTDYQGRKFILINDKTFEIVISEGYETNSQVPAFRCGYVRDLETDGMTFVNGFNCAVPYFKKTIKINSEKDLTDCLLAFPKKIAYQSRCQECSGTGEVVCADCGDGNEVVKCPKCKGEGIQISTSAQDAIIIKLPDNPQAGEMIDITKLVHYEYAPVEIAKYQQEQLDYLTMQCRKVVFNSDIYDKKEVSGTATGKNIDLQNVYDSLYPFALHYANLWMFGIEIMSLITNLNADLNYSMTFGRDFKLKSKDDLLDELNRAKTAGATDFIIRGIEDDIVKLDLADNPMELKKYEIMKFFDPFTGLTPSETSFVVGQLPRYDIDKIYFMKKGKMFDEIELELPEFFLLERTKQKEIIKKKLVEYAEEMKINDSLAMPKLNINA